MLDRRHELARKKTEETKLQLRGSSFRQESQKDSTRLSTHASLASQECSQKCDQAECVWVAWGLVKAEYVVSMTADVLSSAAAYGLNLCRRPELSQLNHNLPCLLEQSRTGRSRKYFNPHPFSSSGLRNSFSSSQKCTV